MPKSRQRKNHKQKSAARSQKIKDAKSKMQKAQTKFIMDLIAREKEKGLFDNTPMLNSIQPPATEGPSTGPVTGPVIEGPAI